MNARRRYHAISLNADKATGHGTPWQKQEPGISEMPGFLDARGIVMKRMVKHDGKPVPDGVQETAPGMVVSLRNLKMLEVNEGLADSSVGSR